MGFAGRYVFVFSINVFMFTGAVKAVGGRGPL